MFPTGLVARTLWQYKVLVTPASLLSQVRANSDLERLIGALTAYPYAVVLDEQPFTTSSVRAVPCEAPLVSDRSSSACLLLCALFACTETPGGLALDTGAAASGTKAAANAGESGQAAESGNSAAAMSGSGGQTGTSAGAGAAGRRAPAAGSLAQGGTPADGGPRDAGTPDAQSTTTACGLCADYALSEAAGVVAASELTALSGLALSRSQPDILYAHNDHDRPVVYALDLQGQLHARITLTGAEARDIEDIAIGNCDTMTCVYLADVGDNTAQRAEYGILRFVEPVVPSAPGDEQQSPTFERLRFRYEDGSHNAESLLVAPNGNLYILTKLAPGSGGNVDATGPSTVYRIDAKAFAAGGIAVATKVTTLSVPRSGEPALSAAAAHPCGSGFLARTYDRVYEFLLPPGAADFEAAFGATPKVVAMPDEPQSEGIDYLADGRGFVTSSEGVSASVMLTRCAP